MVENTQWLQEALLLQVLKDVAKDRVEMTWHHGIEEVADLIVTGDVLHAEQGLGMIASVTLMALTLALGHDLTTLTLGASGRGST